MPVWGQTAGLIIEPRQRWLAGILQPSSQYGCGNADLEHGGLLKVAAPWSSRQRNRGASGYSVSDLLWTVLTRTKPSGFARVGHGS